MQNFGPNEVKSVRTIWISDFHLGSRHSRADDLLDFLKSYECTHLFLVGDIFDGWALARSWFWSQSHNDVVQKLLRIGRKGTSITYIPGNHDSFARDFLGHRFGDILVAESAVHTLMDGRKLLILHGDEFDGIIRYAKWLQVLGAVAYGLALGLNSLVNTIRGRLGKPYWSLSAFLKDRTKTALQYIDDFEQMVAEKARSLGVNGVVCGHIHRAEIRSIADVQYFNCGDWVESCTALVEHLDGRLEIVYHLDTPPQRQQETPKVQAVSTTGDGQAGPIPHLNIQLH